MTNYDIKDAKHLHDYQLEIYFSDGKIIVLDFEKAFEKYVKGFYAKYRKPSEFVKFKVDEGKLVWGKNWDVMFPNEQLYRGKIN